MTFGDMEKLSKLSAILVIPMIAAAIYQEFGLWVLEISDSWNEYALPAYGIFSLAAKAVAFFVCVGVVAFVFIPLNGLLHCHKEFLYFFALSLLTFGLLGFGNGVGALIAKSDVASFNNMIYWHIAALCWGFDIFNTVEEDTNNQSRTDT